jgi:hypothetical protein
MVSGCLFCFASITSGEGVDAGILGSIVNDLMAETVVFLS